MSVAATTELWRMSATDLAEAIRSRQVSSHEVIQAHLRRIEAVNPSVNAVTVVLAQQALDAAKAADDAVAAGGQLPPFHGVPFTAVADPDGCPALEVFAQGVRGVLEDLARSVLGPGAEQSVNGAAVGGGR